MRVLVVEDEEAIASAVARGLAKFGHEVETAADGAEALALAGAREYDVVCLDLNLPRIDGIEVCRRLRAARFPGRIIMLTARSGIRERVEGLDEGADDYLVKPFALSELAARIRAVSRREDADGRVRARGLELDANTNSVRHAGVDVRLTPREFEILHYLARHAGRAVPQEELIERLWGESANPFTQTVKVHMNNLRRKLADGFGAPLIATVRGKGYVL